MSPLKLTKLGDLAYRHGVLTPPSWWKDLLREVRAIADEDGDWPVLLDERIRGMQELRDRYYEITNDEVGA